MGVFILIFSVVILLLVDVFGQSTVKFRFFATGAFIIGSLTSIFCGYIGMTIAVKANYRTTFKALSSISDAFQIAYKAGCVMGFSSVGLGLGILMGLMLLYFLIYKPETQDDYAVLMELVAGYGLGGSAMALFGRVGGGIYTKAADVGADLVGKVENDLDEDSPRNPATIADNVGDNVGDIAGMGSDLFGSFAESTCASLVLIASTPGIIQNSGVIDDNVLAFPLMISAAGILGCFLTSIFGIYLFKVNSMDRIHVALNLQLILSTILTLLAMIGTVYILPETWDFELGKKTKKANRWYALLALSLIHI